MIEVKILHECFSMFLLRNKIYFKSFFEFSLCEQKENLFNYNCHMFHTWQLLREQEVIRVPCGGTSQSTCSVKQYSTRKTHYVGLTLFYRFELKVLPEKCLNW